MATWPTSAQAMSADASGVYAFAGELAMRVPLIGGQPQALGPSLQGQEPPVLTDTDIIWTATVPADQGGTISALSKSGGTPRALALSQGNTLYGLTRDAANLYWVAQDMTMNPRLTSIRTMPLAGGSVSTLLATTRVIIESIAVDDARIYFSEFALDTAQLGQPVAVRSIQKDGTGVVMLWSGIAASLRVVGRSLFWSSSGPNSVLYQADLSSGAVGPVANLDGYVIGGDSRGMVTLAGACDPHPEDTPANCHSWLRSQPAGNQIASADTLTWSAAVYGDFAYWSPGGTDLRRVRR